ncbi:MAG TPA: helix-turn-helix domain-containing protein, partial [Acidimicrobiales bacterium]|nr:helix-turn-helix domain-containing protein [Acidimicrobiales bacterium]
RRPNAGDDGDVFDAAGETRARQGVDLVEMLAGFRLSLEYLHELAGRVAAVGPEREALLLEFLELASSWADFAMLNAANGHRRGELSVAREQQHVQTNLVRRVLTGTAAPAEIRGAVTPLGLDPDGQYFAVRARPEPAVDMEAIERYLGADGLVKRGNGLLALIDGDACGFIGRLPRTAAPTAVGVSDQVALVSMESAFRQAGRALDTALALGVKGIFSFGDLSIQPAIANDADLGAVMLARYVHSVLALPAGSAILDTAERYLANDRNVELTAKDLDVHPNTVRHRLERFEEITGRSLRETETLVELWWALQRRRLG